MVLCFVYCMVLVLYMRDYVICVLHITGPVDKDGRDNMLTAGLFSSSSS